jgi:mono/diheme cytochrome c family protein
VLLAPMGNIVGERLAAAVLLIVANFGAPALAADVEKGKRIAQSRCAPCHMVVSMQRQELSNSPPFDQIAKRNDLDPAVLAFLILSPHPRMNMTLSREEADDLAAYIISLRR